MPTIDRRPAELSKPTLVAAMLAREGRSSAARAVRDLIDREADKTKRLLRLRELLVFTDMYGQCVRGPANGAESREILSLLTFKERTDG